MYHTQNSYLLQSHSAPGNGASHNSYPQSSSYSTLNSHYQPRSYGSDNVALSRYNTSHSSSSGSSSKQSSAVAKGLGFSQNSGLGMGLGHTKQTNNNNSDSQIDRLMTPVRFLKAAPEPIDNNLRKRHRSRSRSRSRERYRYDQRRRPPPTSRERPRHRSGPDLDTFQSRSNGPRSNGPPAPQAADHLSESISAADKKRTYGFGLRMLEKMGYDPTSNEGLGKDGSGIAAPVAIVKKTDRRGMKAEEERSKKGKKKAPGAKASERRRQARRREEKLRGLPPGSLAPPPTAPLDGGPIGSGKKGKARRKRLRREGRLGLQPGALKMASQFGIKHLREVASLPNANHIPLGKVSHTSIPPPSQAHGHTRGYPPASFSHNPRQQSHLPPTMRHGQSTGNYGQSNGNYGQSTGNYGQPAGNYGLHGHQSAVHHHNPPRY